MDMVLSCEAGRLLRATPKYEAYFVFYKSKEHAINKAPPAPGRDGYRENGVRKPNKRGDETPQKPPHKPWPLPQRPGFLIRRLHQIHVALFQEACSAFEMTPLQYSLLSALAVRGTADQTTLAADIALDRTTTTGALKRLEARRLVARPISDDDRRARTCTLTPAGTALLGKIEAAARDAHRATLGNLSKAEQAQFIAMMQRIVADHGSRDSTAVALD